MEVEVDRPHLLDPDGGDGGHGLGVGVVARFVRAGLTDDPALVEREEAGERLGEGRMGLDRPPGLDDGRVHAGQVEEVAGDDARAVPGVEGAGQLCGDGRRRRGGLLSEQQVADHHHPSSQGHLHPGATGLRYEGGVGCRWRPPAELHRVLRLCGRGHVPSIVESPRR